MEIEPHQKRQSELRLFSDKVKPEGLEPFLLTKYDKCGIVSNKPSSNGSNLAHT